MIGSAQGNIRSRIIQPVVELMDDRDPQSTQYGPPSITGKMLTCMQELKNISIATLTKMQLLSTSSMDEELKSMVSNRSVWA